MEFDSNITIKEVKDSDELKEFVMFPHDLYKDSKYWVAVSYTHLTLPTTD